MMCRIDCVYRLSTYVPQFRSDLSSGRRLRIFIPGQPQEACMFDACGTGSYIGKGYGAANTAIFRPLRQTARPRV